MFYYNDLRYQYIMEYPDINEAMNIVFNGFNSERKDARRSLILPMFIASKRAEGYIIPTPIMRSHGVKETTFYKMNSKYPLFECIDENYSYEKKKAKLWMPTDNFNVVMQELLDQEDIQSRFIMARFDCKVIHPSKKIDVEERDFQYDYCHEFHMDIERLENTMKEVTGSLYTQYSMLYLYHKMQKGIPVQYYKRANCGRLFTMNKISIQTVSGEVRDDVFHGYYRIDAANCHWTLLTIVTDDEAIHEYVEDPTFYREMIAKDIKRDPAEVKKALLMMLYGAGEDEIAKLLGEIAKDLFNSHPFVKMLKTGMRKAATGMIDKYGHVEGKYKKNEILAHHLMTLESQILDLAIEVSEDVQGLYFDGLISKHPIDTLHLEALVYHTLGIKVKWTQEQIGIN